MSPAGHRPTDPVEDTTVSQASGHTGNPRGSPHILCQVRIREESGLVALLLVTSSDTLGVCSLVWALVRPQA